MAHHVYYYIFVQFANTVATLPLLVSVYIY